MYQTEVLWFLSGVCSMFAFSAAYIELPKLWRWLKFKVWFNLRYAEGYRKGLADGRRIERQWYERS